MIALRLALGVALSLLAASGASAQPTPTPPPLLQEPAPPPRTSLDLNLGLAGDRASPGWGALEVVIRHVHPRAREVELVVEIRQENRAAPIWSASRRVSLTAGLANAPSRRREWIRIPLRSTGRFVNARLYSAEDRDFITGDLLNLEFNTRLPRTLVFVSSRPTRRSDAATLLASESAYSDPHAALLESDTILHRTASGGNPGPFVRIVLRRPEELPPLRAGYAGIDLLVLHAADLSRCSALQREALVGWVERGGSLLLVPGAAPGWFSSPGISELLEGREVLEHTVDRLPNLERAYGSLVRTPAPRPTFRVFQLSRAPESPLASLTQATDLPDLDERLRFGRTYPFLQGIRRGSGRVFMLAQDPTASPLRSWGGRSGFLDALHPRYEALGALRHARAREPVDLYLDREFFKLLDSNRRPPSQLVVGILIVYLLVVGPLNVAFLRRRGYQPRALAWSVPLCALAFTLVVVLTGFFTKGLGSVVWRGTLVHTVQGASSGQAELTASLRTSAAASYEVQIAEGAGLLRVARVEEALEPQTIRCDAGQTHERVRLDTWEQAVFMGQGEVALGAGVRATRQGERWTAHNGSPRAWARVAVLTPDLRIYSGGPCEPGSSVTLERGAHVSARHAANLGIASALFDSPDERRVASGLLLLPRSTKALRLPGPCLVARLEESPFPIRVGEESGAQLDVPLLIAPAAVWRELR